jgi:hypothetical protein
LADRSASGRGLLAHHLPVEADSIHRRTLRGAKVIG